MLLPRIHLFALAVAIVCSNSVNAAPNSSKTPAKTQAQAHSQNHAIAPAKRYTIEQFMATTKINGAVFSRDEKHILFNSNESGIYNIYRIALDGGKAHALTKSSTESTYLVDIFPGDERMLFTRDSGGNEKDHLFVREVDGTEKDLTPGGAKQDARFIHWNRDKSAFYVAINDRDPSAYDIYQYDSKTYARTKVYENKTGMQTISISRDGRYVVLAKINQTSDSDVFLVNLQSGETKNLSAHSGAVSNVFASFDPAGQRLFYTSNEGGEFSYLRSVDLVSGTTGVHERADWDIQDSGFSPDGRFRYSIINQDSSNVIRLYQHEQPMPLPKTPAGEIRSVVFSDSGKKMAFYVNGDRSPNNLFVHDFASKKTQQLSNSLSPEINPDDLVDTEIVRFKSFDGLSIPSVYYKPRHASSSQKVPAVILVHGGPGGQSKRGYSVTAQYLVNQGYAVLAINNRGSRGYGQTFFRADDKKHGREPLWDCIEAKNFLSSLGHIDHEKIGIMGGSYGGYMTLAALAFRPESFKVGIDIFGVSNWVRTMESMPDTWGPRRQALFDEVGDPGKEKERLIATSPLFHAKEIRSPLLVIQGANDPRVLKVESDEIVEAVKKNQVPVEYVVFPDEGHGFSKKVNEAKALRAVAEFLDKHLKGSPR